MKRLLLTTLTIFCVIGIAIWQINRVGSDTSLSQWQAGAVGYRSAMQAQGKNGKPVLLFFHTEWCQSCKELETNVLGQRTVLSYLQKFNKVQINPELNEPNRASRPVRG